MTSRPNLRLARRAAPVALLAGVLLLAAACTAPALPGTPTAERGVGVSGEREPDSPATQEPAGIASPAAGPQPSTATASPGAAIEPAQTTAAPPPLRTATPAGEPATLAPASPTPPRSTATEQAAQPAPVPSATALARAAGPSPTAAQPQNVELMAPLLVDSSAGRIYAPARTAGGAQARTAVLSAADGRLLKLYDVGGPLGLDAKNGRL